MNTGKRSQDQRLKDRAKIAELYLKGYSQLEIANFLNERFENPEGYSISRQTVSDDLRAIRAIWEESALVNFNERIAKEVAALDLLEKTYHEAYIKSLEGTTIQSQTGYKDNTKKNQGHKVKNPVTLEENEEKPDKIVIYQSQRKRPEGNLKCLKGIENCIEKRCRILGILKNQIDLTSGGKKLQDRNVIVLPSNGLENNTYGFDEDRIKRMIDALDSQPDQKRD